MMIIKQQEFDVQGVKLDAIFVHEINKNVHLGIYKEDGRFMVFSVENGEILVSVWNIWDDFAPAHRDFMNLYEAKRQSVQ